MAEKHYKVRCWSVSVLNGFLQARGLKWRMRKEELVSLVVYAASVMKL